MPNSPDQISLHNSRDDVLGELFQQMRQLTGTDITTLASHLQTTPQTIASFERGEFEAFPPWAETVRIVSSLTLLVNVDCEPILERISHKIHQPGPRRYPGENHPATRSANIEETTRKPPVRVTRKVEQVALSALRRTIFTKRNISLAAIPVIMALAFFIATSFEQRGRITGPLENYAKAGWELFNWKSNDDGLRWIQTDDPRTRKADKLPVYGRGY